MKILYCIAGTYNSGGMERVLANKANYLVRHGYEVVIATTDQRDQASFFALDPAIRCIDLGINYEENNGKSILNKLLKYPFKQLRHRKRLSRLLALERPDITISMYCNEAALLPKMKDGSKKVLEIHFSKFKRMQYGRKGLWRVVDWWRSRMDERLVRRYDKFVVLTKEDKGYWGDLPNIEVIPNARSFNTAQCADLTAKQVLAIGRYSHQKGFERLIEAWEPIAQKWPDWHLEIIGNGEERIGLQRQIDNLGLSPYIQLKEHTNRIETSYLNSSILALSSRYEGLPMVLIEAQTFGLPIVAFACKCGPKDVIEQGKTGILVREGDIVGLSQALESLISDENLRIQMGREAKCASERYDENNIMRRWITLFNQL